MKLEKITKALDKKQGKAREKLFTQIIKSRDLEAMYHLLKYAPDAPLDRICDMAIYLKDARYICLFSEFAGAPREKLGYAISQTNNADWILTFASKNYKDAPVANLNNAILRCGAPFHWINYAKDVKGAPIEELATYTINSQDAYNMFFFAESIEGAPIDKLADGIIKTGNVDLMTEFALNIDNAPYEKLCAHIIASGDEDSISILVRCSNLSYEEFIKQYGKPLSSFKEEKIQKVEEVEEWVDPAIE